MLAARRIYQVHQLESICHAPQWIPSLTLIQLYYPPSYDPKFTAGSNVSCWTGLNGEELPRCQQEVNGSPVACFYDMHISAHTDRCILIIGACDIAICGQTNEAESERERGCGGWEGRGVEQQQEATEWVRFQHHGQHITPHTGSTALSLHQGTDRRRFHGDYGLLLRLGKETDYAAIQTVNVTLAVEDIFRSCCLKHLTDTQFFQW